MTEAELVEHFRKAGIIMLDVTTKEPVISIQRRTDGSNDCSGDALICFLKQPSVELAVTLYDGVELRDRYVPNFTCCSVRTCPSAVVEQCAANGSLSLAPHQT